MTQFNLIVNSLPRDLLEFIFFLAVGFTAGSVGIIQVNQLNFYLFLKITQETKNLIKKIY